MTARLTFVTVPFFPDNPGITGLMYLAWVAYPSHGEHDKRQAFVEAAMAGTFKALGKHVPPDLRHWKRERILPKVNAGLGRIAKRRILSVWVLYKHFGVFKWWDENLSIAAACDALTQFDGRAEYDPEISSPDFETLWRNADRQATPEKNVRRNFYESIPAMAMTIGLPIFRIPPVKDLSLVEMLGTSEWVLPACERANTVAGVLHDVELFDGKRLNVPKHAL